MQGGTAPAASMQRRGEIMAELAKLNQQLETRCEANRRSVQTLRKQAEALRNEIGQRQVLENNLRRLCSAQTRQAMLAADLVVSGLQAAVAEANRREEILKRNKESEEANREMGFESDSTVTSIRLQDFEAVGQLLSAKHGEAMREQSRLQRLALTE